MKLTICLLIISVVCLIEGCYPTPEVTPFQVLTTGEATAVLPSEIRLTMTPPSTLTWEVTPVKKVRGELAVSVQGRLSLISPENGSLRSLNVPAGFFTWSPDGQWTAFLCGGKFVYL